MKQWMKKIDKSFFDGKITVPRDYEDLFITQDELCDVNNKQRGIRITFDGRDYDGKLMFVHQKSRGSHVLQIGLSAELVKKLKQCFIQTYFVIESQKLLQQDGEKFRGVIDGGSQEVVAIYMSSKGKLVIEPFIQITTPYDELFRFLVERNVFGWASGREDSSRFISKYHDWKPIDELNKYVDIPYVVYYLVDDQNKQIYIGSAKRLGDRVVPGRHEIPNWNKFMFEEVHPDFHKNLKEVEYHSIMAFSKFLRNAGKRSSLNISEYVLVNKDYKYYRD